jgi:hypothetical protein
MTSFWGPMGWMTLHSISAAYPDLPGEADKLILNDFMESFAVTISCELCRTHFRDVFTKYKQNIPNWINSKRDLFIMVCRLHNSVNKRLDKPIPKTIAECISSLKSATAYTSQREFRQKYIDYLSAEFGRTRRIFENHHVDKLRKINESYWNTREIMYSDLSFEEDDIVDFKNQPVQRKLVFPRIAMRNVTFPRR